MTQGKGRFRYAQQSPGAGGQPHQQQAAAPSWRASNQGETGWWDGPLEPSRSPFEPAPWRNSFADPSEVRAPSEPDSSALFAQQWQAWRQDRQAVAGCDALPYDDPNYNDPSYGDPNYDDSFQDLTASAGARMAQEGRSWDQQSWPQQDLGQAEGGLADWDQTDWDQADWDQADWDQPPQTNPAWGQQTWREPETWASQQTWDQHSWDQQTRDQQAQIGATARYEDARSAPQDWHEPQGAQAFAVAAYPGQTYPGQTYPGQTHPDQTYPGQAGAWPPPPSWAQTAPHQPWRQEAWDHPSWEQQHSANGQAFGISEDWSKARPEQDPWQPQDTVSWPSAAWETETWDAASRQDATWPNQTWPNQTWPNQTWPNQTWPNQTWPDQTWPSQPQDAWPGPLRTHPSHLQTQSPSAQAFAAQAHADAAHSPARRAALLGLSGLGFVAIGGASTFGFLSALRGPAHALGDAGIKAASDAALRGADSPWLKPITRLALEQAETLEYLDSESTLGNPSEPPKQRLELVDLDPASDIPPALPLRQQSASPPSPLPRSKPASVERQALAWLRANPEPQVGSRPSNASEASLDAMIARLSQELPTPPRAVEAAPAAPATPGPSAPQVLRAKTGPKLRNVHNNETIVLAHRDSQGRLDQGALRELQVFMRDWRNDETRAMDLGLYDQLAKLAPGQELQVISAYRSPQTNAMLRARSGGVAKNSYHLRGQAIDISPARVQLADFYHTALRMNAGGVGYYPGSDFIHIDTGPVREWPARYKATAQAYRKGLA